MITTYVNEFIKYASAELSVEYLACNHLYSINRNIWGKNSQTRETVYPKYTMIAEDNCKSKYDAINFSLRIKKEKVK